MDSRTEKFIAFLKDNNLNFFEIRPTDTGNILLHTENQIATKIFIDNPSRIEIFYEFANCSNVLKQEQILTFLNQLNETNVLKYFWAETGEIVANITYWADDESFNPSTLFSLYLAFYRSLTNDHIVEQVMKIIWR